jgi:hypothetical protein
MRFRSIVTDAPSFRRTGVATVSQELEVIGRGVVQGCVLLPWRAA